MENTEKLYFLEIVKESKIPKPEVDLICDALNSQQGGIDEAMILISANPNVSGITASECRMYAECAKLRVAAEKIQAAAKNASRTIAMMAFNFRG